MAWHRLINTSAPWGDYGRTLVSGMTERRDELGRVPVLRTGPFVPPITLAGISDLIVTDEFRQRLAGSGLRGLGFREANVKKVVLLDWRLWDLDAEGPQLYPAGGEPESYILGRKHNPTAASAVGRLWEVVLEGTLDDPAGCDLIRKAPTPFTRLLASDSAREWLIAAAGEWLDFTDDV